MKYLAVFFLSALSMTAWADQAVTVNPVTHAITQPLGSPSFALANGLIQTTGTFTLTGSYDFSGATGSTFPIAGLSGPTAQGTINGASAFVTTVEEHGGKGDGKSITDLGITASSTTITSASANFTSGDVGKGIAIQEGTHQSFSGTTTASSTTVTVASTSNLVAGMWVSQNINATTTGTFIAGNSTFTVADATGIQVGMSVDSVCLNSSAVPITVSAVSGTSITVTCATGFCVKYPGTDVVVAFNQNILPPGATVASVTDGTHFVLSVTPAYGATGTMDFIPQTVPTTITAVTNTTTATVAVANLISASGCRATYGTDNTSAFQAAFDALGAAGGGTLQGHAGLYYMAGPLQEPTAGGSTAKRNSVILVPNPTTGNQVCITMEGTGSVSLNQTGFLTYDNSNVGGTTIYCPTVGSGTDPTMFCGNASATVGDISKTQVIFKNIEFRKPAQPTIGVANFLNGGVFRVYDFLVDTDGYFTGSNNSHTGSPLSVVDFLMPNFNCAFYNLLSHGFMVGGGTAVQAAQLTRIDDVDIAENTAAITLEPTHGGSFVITNCTFGGDNYVIYNGATGGQANFAMYGGQIENDATGPLAVEYDWFNAADSILIGQVISVARSSTIGSNESRTNTNSVAETVSGVGNGIGEQNFNNYVTDPPAFLTSDGRTGTNGPLIVQADYGWGGLANAMVEFRDQLSHDVAQLIGQSDQFFIQAQSSSTSLQFGNFSNQSVLQIDASGTDNDIVQEVGNIRIATAGMGYQTKEGSNAKQGVATLSGGTITVSNTSVTSNSRIFLTEQSLGTITIPAQVAVTSRTPGTSFTITSSSPTDTSVVAYEIFEPSP